MQPNILNHIAIYLRSAVASGPSASLKLEHCQDYCLSKWGGHGVVFDDTGLSGLSFPRPALDSLIEKAGTGSIKVIVIHDFNALGRDLSIIAPLLDHLSGVGVEVHAVASGGPIGSLVETVLLVGEDRKGRVARMKAGAG